MPDIEGGAIAKRTIVGNFVYPNAVKATSTTVFLHKMLVIYTTAGNYVLKE